MIKAIIIDIDGTLTIDPLTIPEELKYSRGGKDEFYKQINHYEPSTMKTNLKIRKIIDLYIKDGIMPIFVTAREFTNLNYKNTISYLNELFGTKYMLFMRATNDFRPNYEVKKEIYEELIKDEFCIELCLEDENKNTEMFKSLGLQVLKVE